jgi:hypothetical protein
MRKSDNSVIDETQEYSRKSNRNNTRKSSFMVSPRKSENLRTIHEPEMTSDL